MEHSNGPNAIAINCTLKRDQEETSSTDHMIRLIAGELSKHGVVLTDTLRLAACNILPGVTSDEGEGDEWPDLRRRILDHDILIFGTPIWLGQPSSIAKRVLERMDAFLGEADDRGRYPSFGKVAVVGVVGNEDGAHHVTAELFQALNDVGWTIPAAGSCYWVGEAMQSTDFKDLDEVPEPVRQTARLLASSAAHIARLLQSKPYPGNQEGAQRHQQ
ncbi:MAG TPA: NAD(P)H-dependent oxidoreductase [Sphingomicrobium sp.]|nr:NAD(P)H-dependent oxidoreductase [Sphingomicrobium sp.]